jgi:hypothetical protein
MSIEPWSRPLRIPFWCVAVVVGLIQVWAHRHNINPDSISYIEIAQSAREAGWKSYVNGYWSPLYPFLLTNVFRIFNPGPLWESTVVIFANLAIYLANLACFEWFLKELILLRNASNHSAERGFPISSRTLWISGYVFFLWAGQFWVTPGWVSPDLCAAGLCYLATAALIRIHRDQASWATFVFFGVVLGFGYLAKAPMFPLAFVFLTCGFLAVSSDRRAWTRATLAAVVFLMIAAPLAVSLSKAKGRMTFGDNGGINYAEFVNGAPKYVHWEGEPPGTGIPAHPPRRLLGEPTVYEFAAPIGGSYPLWYDPSYWYEGIKPHFSLKGQLMALYRTMSSYLRIISVTGTLYAVFVALFFLVRKSGSWGGGWREEKFVWIPLAAAFGMYALVHVEPRFVGGFGLMLLMRLLAGVRFAKPARQGTLSGLASVIILAPALAIVISTGKNLKDIVRPATFEQWEVARGLHETGIPPGTELGYIGTGLGAYWAHLAGVRIIAEIPDKEQPRFVAADAARRQQVLALFSSVGARAIVTRNADAANSSDGWRQIPGTHYFIWQQPWLIAAAEKK